MEYASERKALCHIHARHQNRDFIQIVIVAMPGSPGGAPIPQVRTEGKKNIWQQKGKAEQEEG
jgi:hypothetical protein